MTEQERLRSLAKQWRNGQADERPQDDPYYEGVYDARHECAEQLEAALAAPTGSTPQRPVHNALTLLMEALNDPHYQQESTEMAREAMQMAKDEIERLNAIVAAEARASAPGADPLEDGLRQRREEARWWHAMFHRAIGIPCDGTLIECKRVAELEAASAPVERPAVAEEKHERLSNWKAWRSTSGNGKR